jgi:fatty acid desaturase
MQLAKPFRLKRKADRAPLALVLGISVAQIAAYLLCDRPATAALAAAILLLPRFMAAMVVHNHAHTPIFRDRAANRVLDLLLYLETGMMVAKFHLHHNCGHHQFYTDPSRDPSTWVRRDGSSMGRLEYVARYFFTHTWKSIRIGRDYPTLLRRYWRAQAAALLALVAALVVNPLNGLILFVTPMLAVWLAFINATYDDHLGLHSMDDFAASFSKTNRLLNLFIFNNGYHLAHHVRPGMHWSELPAFHETIKERIRVPEESTVLNQLFA